ncbi:MAG: hypothetical protein NTY19_52370 [Planctomycetota bacterium]|nr:hypothetical protein [Planctomycetota bacterium]
MNETAELEPAGAEPTAEFYSLDELRTEMKKLAWTKGEYKIVPYGILWGSATYETQRTTPGPFVLYVQSPTLENEPEFEVDTRRTRVGLDVAGPKVSMFGGADTSGKLEVDFHGQFLTENQATIQIRHAYAEVKNEDWKLMAGQTWDLISPLIPGVVNYSVGWDGGNIGFRRMQIRIDRYLQFSDVLLVTPQFAVCQDIIPDAMSRVIPGGNGTSTFDRVIKPESAAWPPLQGRLGFTVGERGEGCQPATCGISGHIGEQGFDYRAGNPYPFVGENVRISTWSFNADLRIPINDRFGVQGEFFTGSNLGAFFGGVGQGINLETRKGIRATGGWGEVWYDWTPRLHSHVGYGIDDPADEDLTAAAARVYNHFLFGNLSFDVTKKMIVGFEISSWKTLYKAQLPGDAVSFEFSGQYGF